MSKLTRKNIKVFGGSSTNTGKFGSAAAGSGVLTTDIETMQSLSAWDNGMASATIGGSKLLPQEEMEAMTRVATYGVANIYQDGIPVYNSLTTYYTGSLVRKDTTNQIFSSLIDNNIGNTLIDGSNWKDVSWLQLSGGTLSGDINITGSNKSIEIHNTFGTPANTYNFRGYDNTDTLTFGVRANGEITALGDININKSTPRVILNTPTDTTDAAILFEENSNPRGLIQYSTIGNNINMYNYTSSDSLILPDTGGFVYSNGSSNVVSSDSNGLITSLGGINITGSNKNIEIHNTFGTPANTYNFRGYDNTDTLTFSVRANGEITALGVYSKTVGGTNRDVYIDNTGIIGYVSSSRRYKENIRDISDHSEKIYNLNPVIFDYIDKSKGINKYGLIAEEVEEILPELCSYNDLEDGSKQIETVNYSDLIPLMLNEIIKLKKEIESLK